MGNQNTTIDQTTGLPSTYLAGLDSYISYAKPLGAEMSASNDVTINHPFASIRALYGDLGANQEIHLSNDNSDFTVTKETFVNVEYPVSTTEPTKQVTKTGSFKVEKKETNIASVVICSLLMVIFIGVGIWMAIRLSKEKADATDGQGQLKQPINLTEQASDNDTDM